MAIITKLEARVVGEQVKIHLCVEQTQPLDDLIIDYGDGQKENRPVRAIGSRSICFDIIHIYKAGTYTITAKARNIMTTSVSIVQKSPTAPLIGFVRDRNGAPLEEVDVWIFKGADFRNAPIAQTKSHGGKYHFNSIPMGSYKIHLQKAGYYPIDFIINFYGDLAPAQVMRPIDGSSAGGDVRQKVIIR